MLDIKYPSVIDNSNFRYILIDDKILSSVIFYDYPKSADFMQVISSIPKDVEYDMAVYISKQDTKKVLKDLTYNIASSSSELKSINSNQQDIDILDKTTNDAKKLRYEIQINNEEIYNVYIGITIYINVKRGVEELYTILKNIESVLYSKQISVNYANFRQLQAYKFTIIPSNLPKEIKNSNSRNFTTSSVANIYPFCTSNIFDMDGIMFGYNITDGKVCNIDVFDKKYLNANMYILGSSGSGKSFFTKLNIIRNYIMGKKQYIFDPEGEYIKLCKSLSGICISYSNNDSGINILDISKEHIYKYKEKFFETKINRVMNYLNNFTEFTDEENEYIKEGIVNAYAKKQINNDVNSIYEVDNMDKIYINKTMKKKENIPNIIDLYNILEEKVISIKSVKEKKNYNNFLIKFKNVIEQNFLYTGYTNVDIDSNNLLVFDLSSLKKEISSIVIKENLQMIKDKLSYMVDNVENTDNNMKTLIYIDEIWKYIGSFSNYSLAEDIFTLYKTIRKLNAGIVSVTQDISDFFEFENGTYGKSILNNTEFKVFFKLEYSDIKYLKNIGLLTDYVISEINRLDKGQAIIMFKNNYIKINIKANDSELKIM